MGLFSGKKKTYVSTSVVRVFEDPQIPDLKKRTILNTIFRDQDFVETLIEESVRSTALNIDRAYRYAKDGNYIYGTPNHNIINAASGRDVLKNIIESELSRPITLDYFQFAPLNNIHMGWKILTDSYGYDFLTNEVVALSLSKGKKVFVENMVGVINSLVMVSDDPEETTSLPNPDAGTLVTWERHPQERYTPFRSGNEVKTPIWEFDEGSDDGVRVHFVAEDGERFTQFFSLASYNEDAEYFQARYSYEQSGRIKYGYFTYEYGSGEYGALDTIHEGSAVGQGTFLPFVMFRNYRENRTAPEHHETDAYKSSTKLCKLLGLDYQSIGDSIHENPDAGKIEQAVLMFGVPAGSSNSAEQRYLFQFFNWIYLQEPNKSSSLASKGVNADRPGKAITISDADFKCTLSYSAITKRSVPGTVADLRKYTSTFINETRTITVLKKVIRNGAPTTVEVNQVITVPTYVYQYQKLPGLYEEIRVENLRLMYEIYKGKGVEAGLDSDQLLIPVDYEIAKTFPLHEREILYYRSMHFVFNSRITVKTKWYQTGIFKFILIVIAITITIFSGGAASPVALAMAAWTTSAVTAVLIIIQSIIISALSSMVVSRALTFVARELGHEVAILLAVVAIAVGGAGMLADKTWGPGLIMVGNGLVDASTAEIGRVVSDYQAESQEFALMAEEEMDELKGILDTLNTRELLDPFAFIGKVPDIRIGEIPTDLYNRTVHSGNIGTVAYDYIESYVDLNLRLPTFHDTMGDTLYV